MTSLVRNHDSSLLAVYILGGWHEAWKDTPAAPNFKDILDFNPESGRSWAVLISTLLIVSDISFGTLLVCQRWTLLEVQRLLQFMFFHAQIQEIEEINTGTAVPMTARYPIKIQQRLTKAFWQRGSALSFCGTTAWTVEVQLRIPWQWKGRFLVRWNHSWPLLILLSEVQQGNVYGISMYLMYLYRLGHINTSCTFSGFAFDAGSVDLLGPWI